MASTKAKFADKFSSYLSNKLTQPKKEQLFRGEFTEPDHDRENFPSNACPFTTFDNDSEPLFNRKRLVPPKETPNAIRWSECEH